MNKPKLLDLFSGAGGAAKGLQRAGFYVVGVDIKNQPHYCGDEFYQADALTFPLEGYDCYWASPPCQPWARMRKLNEAQGVARQYPELIEPIRKRLARTVKPFVIENVPGAPLINPTILCGSFFGLPIRRHRIFETSFEVWRVPCAHYEEVADKPPLHRLTGKSRVVGCYGNGRGKGDNKELWASALNITWMTRKEMSQAIPPAYSEYLGKYLMQAVMLNKEGVNKCSTRIEARRLQENQLDIGKGGDAKLQLGQIRE